MTKVLPVAVGTIISLNDNRGADEERPAAVWLSGAQPRAAGGSHGLCKSKSGRGGRAQAAGEFLRKCLELGRGTPSEKSLQLDLVFNGEGVSLGRRFGAPLCLLPGGR